MPDASPVKWHLAHTSWFFETFVLVPGLADYRPFHPLFGLLFNSYYNAVGERWPRPQRGLLSRPTVAEVFRYRAYVDEKMAEFLERAAARTAELRQTVVLGLHHEQQHQELIVTDLKNAFANNPLHPVYREAVLGSAAAVQLRWLSYPEGVYALGHAGAGFAFDNELPRHRVFLQDFQLASRPVTNEEYLQFMKEGGYQRPDLWLAEGWTTRQERSWESPLYWHRHEGGWFQATLAGLRPVEPQEPVCHVSYYEADAFARWGRRAAAHGGRVGDGGGGRASVRSFSGGGPLSPGGGPGGE
jgi:ergothioneine biosynthesis protein EgtB